MIGPEKLQLFELMSISLHRTVEAQLYYEYAGGAGDDSKGELLQGKKRGEACASPLV